MKRRTEEYLVVGLAVVTLLGVSVAGGRVAHSDRLPAPHTPSRHVARVMTPPKAERPVPWQYRASRSDTRKPVKHKKKASTTHEQLRGITIGSSNQLALGTTCRMRGWRQLAHQHRQWVLWGTSVHSIVMGELRRTAICFQG